MARPFTRRQALQNQRFLDALRRTGNPRLAADLLGVHRSTYSKRRAGNAAFAQDWDAALAFAHAAFHHSGGPRPPEACPEPYPPRGALPRGEGDHPRTRSGGGGGENGRDFQSRTRTLGGELTVNRTRNGRLQLRRAPPGRMTKAGEQAFLAALSATANVRLSAAAAGFSHSAFYRKKGRRPAFAREMRLSLTMAYDRIECAMFAAALPESYGDDAWRHNDPPPIPPLTPDQAFQVLCLHQKSVRQSWDRPHARKRRNEPWETYTDRLRAMWMHQKALERETDALMRAAHYEETGDWRFEEEQAEGGGGVPELPPLHLVTGWSKAKKVKAVHNPELALFGGWRLKDWKKRQQG